MSLKVLTASSTTRLLSLADVKLRLGIAGTSSDYLLEQLIDDAGSTIESYLGRPLSRQRYQEGLSGNDRQRVVLSCIPVDRDSVTLTIDDTAETDFTVESASSGILYREGLWPIGADEPNERGEENVVVTYRAGYILPSQITTFEASKVYAAGAWVRPSTPTLSPLLFEVTTAGTADASEPTWPTTGGDTVTSNTAVFTARHAVELPRAISAVAWLLVRRAWTATQLMAGVREVESDGQRVVFQASDANEAGLTVTEQMALYPFVEAA